MVPVLQFQESRHVKLALNVLGLMCDGQYRDMQNYLREQKDNLTSVNVVGEVAIFLQNFTLDINRETMDLVHLILQTLIEMCVGNFPNQHVIYHRQIIEGLNHIFCMKVFDKRARNACSIRDVRHVHVAIKSSFFDQYYLTIIAMTVSTLKRFCH